MFKLRWDSSPAFRYTYKYSSRSTHGSFQIMNEWKCPAYSVPGLRRCLNILTVTGRSKSPSQLSIINQKFPCATRSRASNPPSLSLVETNTESRMPRVQPFLVTEIEKAQALDNLKHLLLLRFAKIKLFHIIVRLKWPVRRIAHMTSSASQIVMNLLLEMFRWFFSSSISHLRAL